MPLAKFTYGGHHSLFLDFNSLLSRWRPITFEETLSFVKKVKARDHDLYLSLFAILCQSDRTTHEVYEELVLIFQNHDDLLEEITRFRPPVMERRIGRRCSLCCLLFPPLLIALSFFITCEKPLSCLLQNTA
ncbi:hypothetical protein M5K25_024147 [Dendrobium thyrsiflorum]|uniref:Uncharacterized protein n=1 Tax=Dendrobium thyrsiflorum TaxID=117978 RepID=A0ABD0U178_DENTH